MDGGRAEKDSNRAEMVSGRAEMDGNRAAMVSNRAEMAGNRAEMAGNRAEMDGNRAEMDGNRTELEGNRAEKDINRAELEGNRAEKDVNRAELDSNRAESCWLSKKGDLVGVLSNTFYWANRREIKDCKLFPPSGQVSSPGMVGLCAVQSECHLMSLPHCQHFWGRHTGLHLCLFSLSLHRSPVSEISQRAACYKQTASHSQKDFPAPATQMS